MLKLVLTSFTLICFLLCDVQGQDDNINELQKKYLSYILECASEHPVTPADLEDLKNQKMPDKENVRCLFACAYKKAGMMTDNGELSVEGVLTMSKKYFSNDPDRLKKSEEFTEACRTVNDIAVNDGNKGCQRAALIFKCSVEKTPQFDLVV